MSFDQKKNDNIEIDKLNIKSHLNTSLEKDGISVSEDLINRTLEAIRKQSQEPVAAPISSKQEKLPDSKVIPWYRYARNFAVVAAAGLILVLGVNSLGRVDRKEDASGTAKDKANRISYDYSTEGSAPQEAVGNKSDDSVAMDFALKSAESTMEAENDVDYKMAADAADNQGSPLMKEDSVEMTATSAAPGDEFVEGDSGLLSFRDICPILSEDTETITLMANSDKGEKVIGDREDIDNFFLRMEAYAYAEGDNTEDGTLFTITFLTSNGSFTLLFKENTLVTSYKGKDDIIEHNYQSNDYQQLLSDLEGWYKNY